MKKQQTLQSAQPHLKIININKSSNLLTSSYFSYEYITLHDWAYMAYVILYFGFLIDIIMHIYGTISLSMGLWFLLLMT